MGIEKRIGKDPIPKISGEILNESQRLALPGLELLGWELQYVRMPLFEEPIPILFNRIENRTGILNAFDIINKLGDIELRQIEITDYRFIGSEFLCCFDALAVYAPRDFYNDSEPGACFRACEGISHYLDRAT